MAALIKAPIMMSLNSSRTNPTVSNFHPLLIHSSAELCRVYDRPIPMQNINVTAPSNSLRKLPLILLIDGSYMVVIDSNTWHHIIKTMVSDLAKSNSNCLPVLTLSSEKSF